MRKLTIFVTVFMLTLFLAAGSAWANVFASKLAVSATTIDVGSSESTTISFVLNEDARLGVAVEIYDSEEQLVRTLTLENGVAGENMVEWDGKDDEGANVGNGDYTFMVTPTDSGYTEWTSLSTDTLKNIIYAPRGIAINNNLDSPHFGRIFVTNGFDTLGWVKSGLILDQERGMFMYDADQTPVGFSGGDADWNDGSSASPNKILVGEDDAVYVSDFGNDIAWQFDQDINSESTIQLFDETNRDEGQWIPAIWVDGTGEDRAIYTADGHYGAYTGIKEYLIGTDEFVDGLGDTIIHRPSGLFYQYDVELDSEGNVYFNEFRWGANQAYALLKYPSHAGVDTPYTLSDTLWTADISKWTGSYGIGLWEPGNIVAYAHYYDGQIVMFDMTTGAFVDTISGITSRPVDVAFDLVGNVYTMDYTNERWMVISPGTGENSFTTPGMDMITVQGSTGLEDKNIIAHKFYLKQNYPNPFNPTTEIEFSLEKAGQTTLSVYNMLGQEVATLISGDMKAGVHKVAFDGSNLSSGVYIYKLVSGNQVVSKKMSLLK